MSPNAVKAVLPLKERP